MHCALLMLGGGCCRGVPFISISAAEFIEMVVGGSVSSVRCLDGDVLKNPPCIVFIDELDAVAKT